METFNYNLFPTPLTYYKGFLPRSIARDITEYILSEGAGRAEKYQALLGNASSVYGTGEVDFLQEVMKLPNCSKILANLYQCINNYSATNGYPACTINNSWFSIQQPGSLLQRHFHSGGPHPSTISGALYINVDEDSSPITFENPNPYVSLTDSTRNDHTHTFKPEIGDLILFPSWLFHYSNEINKSENRIIISFNAH